MNNKIAALAMLAALTSCTMNDNPLLTGSPLPYGAPQFDKIENRHYLPAFKEAISEAKAQIDAIVSNPDAPTFENTVEALENSGLRLNSIASVFYNLAEANTSDEMQQIDEQLSPLMTEFEMYVMLNDGLFQRVRSVYDSRESLKLDQAQRKLLEDTYKSFARNGAALSPADKEILAGYEEKLSLLSIEYGKNLLASTNAFTMLLTSDDELAGLPEFVREQAAQAAREKGREGWLFDLSAPSYGGFMQYSDRRDLREKMYRAYNTRAFTKEYDNSEVLKQIADLRSRKAQLLGYRDYADYQTEERMVKSGDNVWKFIEELKEPALPKARQEVADLTAYARSHGFTDDVIMPWDFSYWTEKLRVEKYSLKDEELKPYFKLESCIDAIFSLANRLYGLNFKETDLPVYHPDVKVYDVTDADGKHLALFYADFFPRESKRSGAWMTSFGDQMIVDGIETRPFISLVTNFTKPTENEPSLLTHDEFTTMLHEFGHSLHGIMAQGRYHSQTGTSVDHDFVELPSQIMENWAFEEEFLKSFAKHYKTGEPIPSELIDRIIAAKNFESAYYHMRQLQYGILDMSWHTLTEMTEESALQFETRVLQSSDVVTRVPECIVSTSFSHIFKGGYAAGYYSYKWAEVLAADAFSLFKENGIFDKATAARFRHLLEQGGSVDAADLYREFRGHDPQPEALLKALDIIE